MRRRAERPHHVWSDAVVFDRTADGRPRRLRAIVDADTREYRSRDVARLPSIIADGCLWCDAKMAQRSGAGTTIGMDHIKRRRREELTLTSHPSLHVGDCVPFYFCPRSVMLYLIHKRNPELAYRGGQEPVLHLEADLHQVVNWADAHDQRWAFTTSNAGSYHFDDYANLAQLAKLDWDAIHAKWWSGSKARVDAKYRKQAEFLLERSFPWALITRIGVLSGNTGTRTLRAVQASNHQPPVEVRRDWYY